MTLRLSADGLIRSFGDLTVGPIDIALHPGRAVALIGPNGCGKSTALRMIAGLIGPSSGTVTMDSSPTAVWSNTGSYGHLSVRSNLRLAADLQGASGGAVEDVVTRLGLSGVRDMRASRLSTGMRRRLDIGLALVGDRKILLLDEPSSGIDRAASADIVEALRSAKQTGAAIVLASHHASEVADLADEILLGDAGEFTDRSDLVGDSTKIASVMQGVPL